MAQTSYTHTQRSCFNLIFLAIIAAVFLNIFLNLASSTPEPIWFQVLAFGVSGLLLVFALAFSSLTVTVDQDTLTWHFGLEFWKKSTARSEITNVRSVETRWWDGWGIRWTPNGWLYNVAGFDAVAVTTRDGKTVMIGTDEPDTLVSALGF